MESIDPDRESSVESFAERIKRFRTLRRLSLKEVAAALGIPVATYREWEQGRTIRGQPYARMAEVFGISLLELLTGQKPSKIGVLKEVEMIEKNIQLLKKELEYFLGPH